MPTLSVLGPDDDWSATATLNAYGEAVAERWVGGGGLGGGQYVDGDDAQDALKLEALQHFALSVFDAVLYVNGSAVPTGGEDGGLTYWTVSSVRTAVFGGNNDWTRKYPREIDSLAATTDVKGEAVSNGTNARYLTDGKIYTRSGGAWVLVPAATVPDVVTKYGPHESGDYIGPWIFNEVREVLLKAVTHTSGPLPAFAAGQQVEGRVGETDTSDPANIATAAAAKASAATEFAASGDTGGGGILLHARKSASVVRNASNFYDAGLNATRSRLSFGDGGITTPSAAYTVYGYATVGGNDVFDDNGDGWAEDAWTAAGSGTVVRDVPAQYSGWLGSLSQPAWPADPTFDGHVTSKGYDLTLLLVVVTPAFEYT